MTVAFARFCCMSCEILQTQTFNVDTMGQQGDIPVVHRASGHFWKGVYRPSSGTFHGGISCAPFQGVANVPVPAD